MTPRRTLTLIASAGETAAGEPRMGHVALVGAGPGDPELITVRGLSLLQQADLVVYDRLVAPALLDHCREDCRRIYVGKASGAHSLSQEEINALLVREARSGLRVVRLKGGDPFVFGRGGEEMLTLRAAGVPVTVVPGITAAAGCAAALGVPLTHRGLAHGVTLVTAHRRVGSEQTDWARLAREAGRTLVCYMGLAELAEISDGLISAGMSPHMPAVLVSQGTTVQQRAVQCTVRELAVVGAQEKMMSPCLLMIGEVVSLADTASLSRPAGSVPAEQGNRAMGEHSVAAF